MQAIEQVKLASYLSHQAKQASVWGAAKGIADVGSYVIPGVGTARMGYDAFNDFRQGNLLGGAANLVGAGLSLIPGVGIAGRGVSWLGRLAGKGLSRIGAPTLGAAARIGGRQLGRGLNMVNTQMNKVAPGVGKAVVGLANKMPSIGGPRFGKNLMAMGNYMKANPTKTMLAGGVGAFALGRAGENVQQARQLEQQNRTGMSSLMNSLRSRPMIYNPMYAPGGRGLF